MSDQLFDRMVTLSNAETLRSNLEAVMDGDAARVFCDLLERFAGRTLKIWEVVNGHLPTAFSNAVAGGFDYESAEGEGRFFSVLKALIPDETDYAYAYECRMELWKRDDNRLA